MSPVSSATTIADVFTGLAVSLGLLKGEQVVPSERITGIWPDRVETDLDAAELGSLPLFEEEPVESSGRRAGGASSTACFRR